MTLSAIIFALQMMFGSANVATTPDAALYQAQQAGIIVVGDTLETN